jgi:Spy/CpxP family protein refolding chaperone
MTLRSRVGGMVMGMALVGAMGIIPSFAQDPAKEDGEATASRASRRVPAYFSKAGVTPEQKEQIYAIRAKYQIKIEALKKQVDDAEQKELTDCENVLLPAQKKLLDQYRAEAKTKAKSRTKAAKAAEGEKAAIKADK